MNNAVIKMVGIGVASFISGAIVGALAYKIAAYPKLEEREMKRYDEEIARTRARLMGTDTRKNSDESNTNAINDIRCQTFDTTNKKTPEVKENNDVETVNYASIYSKIHGKYSPPEKSESIAEKNTESNRYSKPILVDGYEALSVMLSNNGKNEEIFEWVFYYNYKGGVMIDFQTDQFVNYNKIMKYSKRELLDIFMDYRSKGKLPDDQTLYFFIPGDDIGAAIQLDGDLRPELMETDIPSWAYPHPSDEDDDDDEEEDYEFDPDF